MKPLLAKDLKNFTKRFHHFIDGEIRAISLISPTEIKVIIAGQDEARAYDWLSIELLFDGIVDAKLLDDKKLSLVDMTSGISIFNEDSLFYFGIDTYTNSSNIKNSISYIVCKNLKYKESSF